VAPLALFAPLTRARGWGGIETEPQTDPPRPPAGRRRRFFFLRFWFGATMEFGRSGTMMMEDDVGFAGSGRRRGSAAR